MSGHLSLPPGLRRTGEPLIDIASLPQPPAWVTDALCAQVDNDGFFPETGGPTRALKQICGGCEVQQQCLEYALETEASYGVWGGLTAKERRDLKRRRKVGGAA